MEILISSNFKKYFNTHIDFIDHYWIKYFEQKKINFFLIPNSIELVTRQIKNTKRVNLIILAGGNDVFGKDEYSKKRLAVEFLLIKFAIKKNIPILGICRGMQVLNFYFKGKLDRIKGHMRVTNKVYMKNSLIKDTILNVKCFHNYGIKKNSLSKIFEIYATDKKQNIEMCKHKSKKIYGVMWHPERDKNYKILNKIINKITN